MSMDNLLLLWSSFRSSRLFGSRFCGGSGSGSHFLVSYSFCFSFPYCLLGFEALLFGFARSGSMLLFAFRMTFLFLADPLCKLLFYLILCNNTFLYAPEQVLLVKHSRFGQKSTA